MPKKPSYLRVVVTARCTLACDYCHQEGDPATARPAAMPTEALISLIDVAVRQGIRKLKFLGGEPLLRDDLPRVIAAIRADHPQLDISLITGGAARVDRLSDCFDAGLSRANLSIHGWTVAAFSERTRRGARAHLLRAGVLEHLLDRGRFLKLNFVYRGPADEPDLATLLDWAAARPVVVSVLDDLGNPRLGPADISAALRRLRGLPVAALPEPDPHSLPTRRWRWRDGLEVEIKDHQLGRVAPWASCATCPVRDQCREGIHALRLTHDGLLRPCMDREDISAPLLESWTEGGSAAATALWARSLHSWIGPSAASEAA